MRPTFTLSRLATSASRCSRPQLVKRCSEVCQATYSMYPLLFGLLLDLLLGDPRWALHPIRLFGKLIAWGERWLNHPPHQKAKGTLLSLVLVLGVWGFFYVVEWLLADYRYALLTWQTIFFFFAICPRSLIGEALAVERYVVADDLEGARKRLSWIVGRDTSQLTFAQIRTAVLETLAENLSDGVIAPLFFYALGGVPLMMAYKMINTLDSMIGYKDQRYKDFGYFAARILDDAANYIPSRLTALLMLLVAPSRRAVRSVWRDARKHASPNSGYPESALAGILGVQFGGPNIYHGMLVEKPYIGTPLHAVTAQTLRRTIRIVIDVTLLASLLVLLTYLYR